MARHLRFPPPGDPRAAARAAGLRYSTDTRPGIRRVRKGRSFTYVRPDGRRLTDAADLARIRQLAVPPAWTDVWISPDPRGHLQATGRDARGGSSIATIRDGGSFATRRSTAGSPTLPARFRPSDAAPKRICVAPGFHARKCSPPSSVCSSER